MVPPRLMNHARQIGPGTDQVELEVSAAVQEEEEEGRKGEIVIIDDD